MSRERKASSPPEDQCAAWQSMQRDAGSTTSTEQLGFETVGHGGAITFVMPDYYPPRHFSRSRPSTLTVNTPAKAAQNYRSVAATSAKRSVSFSPSDRNPKRPSTLMTEPISGNSKSTQDRANTVQPAGEHLAAKNDNSVSQPERQGGDASTSNNSPAGKDGDLEGNRGNPMAESTRKAAENGESSKNGEKPATNKGIKVYENFLTLSRPRGVWKDWSDDDKINATRWFAVYPEDMSAATVAKWEMPEQEMWPFFTDGGWQMPFKEITLRLVKSEVEVRKCKPSLKRSAK